MKLRGITAAYMSGICAVTLMLPFATQAKEIETTEKVDVVTIDAGDYDRECYYYIPTSTAVGTRSCNSPIMIVFGDEKYTEESVIKEANESGLAEIAAKEGSIVVFANPYSDTWSADTDAELYTGIISTFSDSSGYAWVDGKYAGTDWMSGNEVEYYCGSSQRTYLFGDGNGADYIADNLLKQVFKTVEYPSGPVEAEVTPTSYILSNLSSEIDTSYAGVEFPTAIINGPDEVKETLQELNPIHNNYVVLTSDEKEGFDSSKVLEAYQKVGNVRRQSNTILDIPNYEKLGIEEIVKDININGNDIEYRLYIPEKLDLDITGSVPVVMAFHGGGSTAEFFAWSSEWPIIGNDEGFMVIAVQNHDSYTSEEMVELLESVEKEYPAIDKTRIYASGFSMGGVKSWNCGLKYSDVFAGVAPFDAGYSEEDALSTEYVPINIPENANVMPLFFVGGTKSFAPELPQKEPINVNAAIAAYFKLDGVTDEYAYDEAADEVWGYEADNTYVVENTEYTDCPLTVSEFKSSDGNTYISLGYIPKGHETMSVEARQAWAFLSKFSRNEDGTLTISEQDGKKKIWETAIPREMAEISNNNYFSILLIIVVLIAVVAVGVVWYNKKREQ